MKINTTKNSNRFCGPAALASLTGLHVDEATKVLRFLRSKRTGRVARIRGVRNVEMIDALRVLGFSLQPIAQPIKSQTVAQFLRKIQEAVCTGPMLVNTTGHYIVVRGRKIYDNFNYEGIWLNQYQHRRKRVKRAWVIFGNLNRSIFKEVEEAETIRKREKAERVEYKVQTLDEYGDVRDYIYEGNDKGKAMMIAEATPGHVEVERITWDSMDSPEFDLIYEKVK